MSTKMADQEHRDLDTTHSAVVLYGYHLVISPRTNQSDSVKHKHQLLHSARISMYVKKTDPPSLARETVEVLEYMEVNTGETSMCIMLNLRMPHVRMYNIH